MQTHNTLGKDTKLSVRFASIKACLEVSERKQDNKQHNLTLNCLLTAEFITALLLDPMDFTITTVLMVYVQWLSLSCLCWSVWHALLSSDILQVPNQPDRSISNTCIEIPHTVLCLCQPLICSAICLHKRQAHHGAAGCTYYSINVFFFSCPTCSFYVLVAQELQNYHLLCPSPPRSPCLPHPSHSSYLLCPSCFHLHCDYRCGGCCCCCCCCSDLGPRGGPDLCLHGDPGLRSDHLRCDDRSCRCGGGDCLHGAPGPPRVCPVNCLLVREEQAEGSCWAVDWSDWRALSSGSQRWWSHTWTWWCPGTALNHWGPPLAQSSGCQHWSSLTSC